MDRIIRLKIPSVGEYECVHISWLFHLKRYICTSVAFHKVLKKTKSHLLIFVINIKLITESITFKDKIVFVHQEYR